MSRSSGPGGQHAQKSSTRVEASLDVEASTALTDIQKHRVVATRRRRPPGGRAGRAEPGTQPRARGRAPRREAARGAGRSAPARSHATRRQGARAPPRGEAPARADEGAPEAAEPGIDSPAVDVLRLATLLPELPRERTRLLDNLGRVRREVGPITMELSDALADHMNIRRGEVHEVVSFYSFLQVPTDAVRVCTGPVCDCFGARELLASTPGAIEVACLGHCDLAPAMTRGDEIVPAVTHSTNDGPAVGLGDGDATLADYEARGGLSLLRDLPVTGADRRGAEGVRTHRVRGRGLPDRDEVGGGRARARSPLRRRQRRRGRAGDDQGPLRHGAPAAPDGRGDRARDARARRRRGLHLPPRGVCARSCATGAGARGVPRRPGSWTGSRSSSSSAPARTSPARRRRCSSRWRAAARCRGSSLRSRARSGYLGRPTLIQNVETLAHIPAILRNGGEWWAALGTRDAKGTRLWSVTRCGGAARLLRGRERRDDARAGGRVRGRVHGRRRCRRTGRRCERDPAAVRPRRAADARRPPRVRRRARARRRCRSSPRRTPRSGSSPRRCASSPRSRARSARRAGSATARSTTSRRSSRTGTR